MPEQPSRNFPAPTPSLWAFTSGSIPLYLFCVRFYFLFFLFISYFYFYCLKYGKTPAARSDLYLIKNTPVPVLSGWSSQDAGGPRVEQQPLPHHLPSGCRRSRPTTDLPKPKSLLRKGPVPTQRETFYLREESEEEHLGKERGPQTKKGSLWASEPRGHPAPGWAGKTAPGLWAPQIGPTSNPGTGQHHPRARPAYPPKGDPDHQLLVE